MKNMPECKNDAAAEASVKASQNTQSTKCMYSVLSCFLTSNIIHYSIVVSMSDYQHHFE